jgi:hypothetical protein
MTGGWRQYYSHPADGRVADQNAPAGGPGPGGFVVPGPLGLYPQSPLIWPSPNAPPDFHAGPIPLPGSLHHRQFDWRQLLPLYDERERIAAILRAGMLSQRYFPGELLRIGGAELQQMVEGLVPALLQAFEEALEEITRDMLWGAIIGGAAGALAGGAGAIPGAAIGAEVGLDVALIMIDLRGLADMLGEVADVLLAVSKELAYAFSVAWFSVDYDTATRENLINQAALLMAEARVLIFLAVLRGLLAFLLRKGIEALPGQLREASGRLRKTKFGTRLAEFLEKNQEKLRKVLDDKKERKSAGRGASSSAGGGGGGEGKPPPPKPPPSAPPTSAGKTAAVPARRATKPSLDPHPSNKPRGKPTAIPPNANPEMARSLGRENETAEIMSRNGYDVEQNPSAPGLKKPDYKVEGQTFDCYSPKDNTSVRNVWSEVKGKVDEGQTNRVVVNLRDWKGDPAALQAQFEKWPVKGLDEVITVQPDGSLSQILPK